MNINLLRYTREEGRAFYQRVVDEVEQLPLVESVSLSRIAVLAGSTRVISIGIDGQPNPPGGTTSESAARAVGRDRALANVVGSGFFRTLGIPLIRGRSFDEQDTEDHPAVAIINETMAARFFPGTDAIGQRLSAAGGGPDAMWTEIVGIVKDSKYASLSEAPAPVVYLPLAQRHETGVTLYVRTAGAPSVLVAELRRTIQALEPDLPVPNIQTVNDTIAVALYAPRMGAALLSGFGALALLLAALGVYGVLAFSMSRRSLSAWACRLAWSPAFSRPRPFAAFSSR